MIILLNYGTLQVLGYDPSKCPFSSFFQAHQKMHLSHTILTIKRHFQGKKNSCIVHKKFQRFKKWGQMLSLMLSSGISGTTCPGARVPRSQKTPVRFCWYIAHFEAFGVLVHLHLVAWMGTHRRSCANCGWYNSILPLVYHHIWCNIIFVWDRQFPPQTSSFIRHLHCNRGGADSTRTI